MISKMRDGLQNFSTYKNHYTVGFFNKSSAFFFFFFNMDKEIVQGFLAIVVSSIQDYPEMP